MIIQFTKFRPRLARHTLLKYKGGFTLLEIIVVMILVSVIASFAFPQFAKSVRKERERQAIIQLSAINAANQNYFAQTASYLPTGTGDAAELNASLALNIIENDLTFTYTRTATTAYNATATDGTITIRVNQNVLSNTNPCCAGGTCPSLPDC